MRNIGVIAIVVSILTWATTSHAALWNGYEVGSVLPPDSRDFIFFRLVGVSQADPAVPNAGPWFAVPRTAVGFKEIYALLLAAKAAGWTLTVQTTGQEAPGQCAPYALVAYLHTTS